MKHIFVINGSASEQSSNLRLIERLGEMTRGILQLSIFNDLKTLPHFNPELSVNNTPPLISDFRRSIELADGIIICTPEYVFSIPSGLKNAIEWCIATTVFANKPTGIITASANGVKGHEELQLIMQTVMARFTPATTLLIQGIKGKINLEGQITDPATQEAFAGFIKAYQSLLETPLH